MTNRKRFGFLHYGILVTVIFSSVLTYNLFNGDQRLYLPGELTHGHHQIEMVCSACHVEAFDGGGSMQDACVACHGAALEKARDTHPKSKFTDPRNLSLLVNLDATRCVACHVEHSPEITGKYGVTMPEDFCFHCHKSIAQDRPSHKEFAYNSCSNAGCHNYHDNKALYENFLAKHLDEEGVLAKPQVKLVNSMTLWLKQNETVEPLSIKDQDGAEIEGASDKIAEQWASSAHAVTQVNCADCHPGNTTNTTTNTTINTAINKIAGTAPKNTKEERYQGMDIALCASCHERQVEGFSAGLHGMRPALVPQKMRVSEARLPMHQSAGEQSLSCTSCHNPHKPDLKSAAVKACLECHNDEHSNNYKSSSHAVLWEKELYGLSEPGSGVSCATCHMPREKKGKRVFVNHNQNDTLEPNSKMLRAVCLHCHGLEYSMAALSDRELIRDNFSSSSGNQHKSFELIRKRLAAKKRKSKR